MLGSVKYSKMKSVRQYRKKKFDYSKYVKNFYLEDGIAYITCKVNSYDDVISRFSIKGYEWMNQEFVNYIEANAYYIPIQYPIIIELCGHTFTENEKHTIETTLKDYLGLKVGDKQIDLENNTQKSIISIILGFLSFGLNYIASKVLPIAFNEFVSILFWFFIWEAADIIVLERNQIKTSKIEAAQLASANIVFTEVVEIQQGDDYDI